MKLWQKNYNTAEKVELFTVGNDKDFDLQLAPYDVQASIAHVKMIQTIDLLTADEAKAILSVLDEIAKSIAENKFSIEDGVEDVHSQIEFILTQKLGETGKKVHSGRSRNDQVLVAIKLFLKDKLKETTSYVEVLFNILQQLSEAHKQALIPGYTHLQIAMPSSFGLWFGAYAESLVDDMELVAAAYAVADKNPLGSAAGYGSSFPLNRSMTTALMNFSDLNYNVVYAQMTRGKSEKFTAIALAGIAATLSKFSMDVCLYMSQNFGFITFPDNLTTGSSIMPHKKNPDVFELIRGKCNRLQALPNELALLTSNLPSGYHREMQLTKEIIFPAFETLNACLDIAAFMLNSIKINNDILNDPKYNYLFSVESVNKLVMQGVPFRDAYKQVASEIESDKFTPNKSINHTHEGSIGNLCNDKIAEQMKKIVAKIR